MDTNSSTYNPLKNTETTSNRRLIFRTPFQDFLRMTLRTCTHAYTPREEVSQPCPASYCVAVLLGLGYRLQPLFASSPSPHPLPLSAHSAWWSGSHLKPHVAVRACVRVRSFAEQQLEWDGTDMPACLSATSVHVAADLKI